MQTTPFSCVHDAFKAAGLPADNFSLYGVTMAEIKAECERRGLKYLEKGYHTPRGRIIVCYETKNGGGHAEYFERIPPEGLYYDRGLIILLD